MLLIIKRQNLNRRIELKKTKISNFFFSKFNEILGKCDLELKKKRLSNNTIIEILGKLKNEVSFKWTQAKLIKT